MNYWDAEELACAMLGLDYDELVNDGRESEIEDAIYEKFEISMTQFCDIVEALLPFTPLVQGGLTNTLYHAFVDVKENRAIVKKEYKEES
jgi:hypothetical protein